MTNPSQTFHDFGQFPDLNSLKIPRHFQVFQTRGHVEPALPAFHQV